MSYPNTQIKAPRQTSGSTFLQWIIGVALLVVGFRIGYCADTDWDDDGLSNKVELKCYLDPHNADSDGDSVKDGDEIFTCFLGTPTPSSNILLTDTICLTALNGAKEVCFHPSDIILFERTEGCNLIFDWQADAKYVQENLTKIEHEIRKIGYSHFFRINRQDLANMLHAQCFDNKNNKLYLSLEENIWCSVSREKSQELRGRVKPCD